MSGNPNLNLTLADTFPGTIRRKLFMPVFLAPVLVFSPCITLAQNSFELRYLIFDPVLIKTSLADDELKVEEISHPPAAEEKLTVGEYISAEQQENETSDPDDLAASIAGYEKSISDLELEGGAYEAALGQEYLSLGTLYQSQGDHEKALEYLDKALHIERVNRGLFNLDQEPIINKKIESYLALGDLESADHQQEYLFYLKRKTYGDSSIELLPALTQYAEWNIFAFDARLGMNPALDYGAESAAFTAQPANNSIGEENFRTNRLVNAQNIYRTIIQILVSQYGQTDPRLLDMEKNLALTNYFFATNYNINSASLSSNNNPALSMASSQAFYDVSQVSSNSMGYRHGREALERRLDYMLNMDNISPEEITRAEIELGDWLLIFKKRMTALDTYESAYQELKAKGVAQDAIDEIFSPAFPVEVPTFINYKYTRASLNIPEDLPLDYQGYFDVRLKLNRFGQPQNVEVIGRSLNTTDPIEFRLMRHLRSSTFRPRFSNDTLLDQDVVEARYYYSY